MVYVDEARCKGCGLCIETCPLGAIALVGNVATIDQEHCTGCEACVGACPNGAILVVTEAVEEKAVVPRVQPRSHVASRRPAFPTIPLKTQLVPLVGSALVFLGREVLPRLIPRLVNALDQRADRSTLASSGKGRGGRRFRKRRRGK